MREYRASSAECDVRWDYRPDVEYTHDETELGPTVGAPPPMLEGHMPLATLKPGAIGRARDGALIIVGKGAHLVEGLEVVQAFFLRSGLEVDYGRERDILWVKPLSVGMSERMLSIWYAESVAHEPLARDELLAFLKGVFVVIERTTKPEAMLVP